MTQQFDYQQELTRIGMRTSYELGVLQGRIETHFNNMIRTTDQIQRDLRRSLDNMRGYRRQ